MTTLLPHVTVPEKFGVTQEEVAALAAKLRKGLPPIKTMAEIIGEPNDAAIETAFNVFTHECGKIEQVCSQRKLPSPIEYRKMQWEATKKIIAAYNSVTEK